MDINIKSQNSYKNDVNDVTVESFENKKQLENQEENNEPEEMPEIKLSIMVSPNHLNAYLRVLKIEPTQELTCEEVEQFLIEKDIKYGVFHDQIKTYCKEKNFHQDFLVAKGITPVDGTDGVLKFYFKKYVENKPKERADGTVDYRNLDLIQNVKQGDILCEIIPPILGKNGIGVYNDVLPAIEGESPIFPSFTNVVISDDKLKLIAEIDGAVTFNERANAINISAVHVIKNNVDNSCGNINFNGTIVVNGDIREGFEVTAGKDILVKGTVEGAKLTAGGNITLRNGMVGMSKGVLSAEGDINSSFIENASVICKGSLICDVIINSNVEVDKNIYLKGKMKSLMGGKYLAGEKIVAKNIGTNSNIPTLVSVKPVQFREAEKEEQEEQEVKSLAEYRQEIKQKEVEIEEIDKKMEKLNKIEMTPENTKNKIMITKKLISQKNMVKNEISLLKKEYAEREEIYGTKGCEIICSSNMHIGVKIVIGNSKYFITQTIVNQKAYVEDGEIVFGQILPGDMDEA